MKKATLCNPKENTPENQILLQSGFKRRRMIYSAQVKSAFQIQKYPNTRLSLIGVYVLNHASNVLMFKLQCTIRV